VDYPGNHDSEDEVESVDNDMARSMATERVGFGTNSLLEQWRDSYENGDYDEDPYDDDMYEGQDIPDNIQDICDNLDIRVRALFDDQAAPVAGTSAGLEDNKVVNDGGDSESSGLVTPTSNSKSSSEEQPKSIEAFQKAKYARAYTVGPGEKKVYGGSKSLCPKCNYHHDGQCAPKCNHCMRAGHLARDCRSLAATANNQRAPGANQRVVTCFECGAQGHYKRDCPKLKNNNRGNQACRCIKSLNK
ncbi:putative reverse transcriptase domain-containing protein, partial [Tanacetum coccineum]